MSILLISVSIVTRIIGVSHWHLAGCFSFGLLASGLLVILWLMRGSLPVGRMGEGEGAQIHSHRIVALAKRARRLNC
jgi:hypothetical protein